MSNTRTERRANNARILAIIPAYNEENHIANVVSAAISHLPVLVVDDGSSDETATRAKERGADVLDQVPNQGKGCALKAGFRWAIAKDYDAVLTLDADGQHDPAEIPKFLKAYDARYASLIIGSRDFSQMPPLRRLSNSLGRWSFSLAVGRYIPDNQSGYRLIDRKVMEGMLDSSETGFEFEVEMIIMCVRRNLVFDWVPIRTIYGDEGSHINNVDHVVNFIRILRRARSGRAK